MKLVEVGARGFIGSSVYDLLTIFSICGSKRTKALKLLAVLAKFGAGEMRFLLKDEKCSNCR